ncbi:MAG: hypothetical protein KatS3mg077_0635 [Candidatus Binatia bacterium]|nr:MAG: hypothetical protein KatS3mg077_0635 [Candidatus Binatia bacterium]
MALPCGLGFWWFLGGWRTSAGRFLSVLCLVSVLVSPSAFAQLAKTNRDMREVGDDPRGLPAEVFAQKPLAILAREMLLESHLDKNAKVPRPQRKGVQVELFTPGDFGVLVRYRW